MYLIFKNVQFAFLAFLICFGLLACDSDSDPIDETTPEPTNIMDFLKVNGYDSLAVALETTRVLSELDEEFEYTLFAPTNAAFQNYLANNNFESMGEIPETLIAKLLMNHLLEGAIRTSDFSTGYIETMAKAGPNNENLSLYINKEFGLLINGVSTIKSPDNEMENLIVHGVHQVIDLPLIDTFIYPGEEHDDDPRFDSLSDVIFWNGPRFDENSAYTVFAPINEAFAAFYSEYGEEEEFYREDPEMGSITLRNIVEYHIISKVNLRSEELIDGMTVTTVQGEDLTINLNGEVTLTDVNGRTATIITKDIQAVNGVIHAIDTVLIPDLSGE